MAVSSSFHYYNIQHTSLACSCDYSQFSSSNMYQYKDQQVLRCFFRFVFLTTIWSSRVLNNSKSWTNLPFLITFSSLICFLFANLSEWFLPQLNVHFLSHFLRILSTNYTSRVQYCVCPSRSVSSGHWNLVIFLQWIVSIHCMSECVCVFAFFFPYRL